MRRTISKLGVGLSGAYLALYIAMAMFAIYVLVTNTAHSEFSGMGMILVTYPWSLMWGAAMDQIGLIAWYEQFAGHPALYGVAASLTLLPAAIPYAVILYLVGWLLEKAVGAPKGHP